MHQFDIVSRERRTHDCAVTIVFVIETDFAHQPRMLRKTFLVPLSAGMQDEDVDREARAQAAKYLERKLAELRF
jgi:hypothetical protein